MKIKNIFGEEMDERGSIGVVLDALYDDFNISPTVEMKASKLATWHLALEDISDMAIAVGYKKCISEQLKFIPSSGAFRKFCIFKKVSISQDKDFVPPPNLSLNNKNSQLIINKLRLPEKLKQDEFEDFKKNRKVIEFNRKNKVKS